MNKTIAEQQGPVSINKQAEVELVKTNTKTIPSSNDVTPVTVNKPRANTITVNKPVAEKNQPQTNKPASSAVTKPAVKQDQQVVKTQPVPVKQQDVVTTKPQPEVKQETVVAKPVERKPDAEIIKPAAVIEGRKSEFSQVVNFKSDSLVLKLYDNGEIDGDTVSVFLNGQVLMAKQGLKSSAIRKTIYIKPGDEDFTIVLYADNLGKYPPNTGLLVVEDGEDVYNLRFSSDMQKSSGIVFRKKQ